ncbi:PadR family transcriptional regulator [Salinithrix halophila]|uniref:PadR family transcriptional regulator n=1 Tax=Salinithrix halophila TaxID=1485204 RepID=A0ABV8JFM5_9BACL
MSSAVRLLVLGAILRRGVSHGYGVYRDITAWRAETWTKVKPGSIYHAMTKLESQGLLKTEDSGDLIKRGPSRTEYTVTPQGCDEFESLLEDALTSFDVEWFSSGIAFMDRLPRNRVVILLEERLTRLEENDTFLKTLPTEAVPSDPSRHPELVGLWIGYIEFALIKTRHLIQSLQAGEYQFSDESNVR